jgi:putative ABC transport system permease protein
VTALARVLRGLVHRGSATALLVLLAVVAAAAAAAAPAYDQAARSSIIADVVAADGQQAAQLEVTRMVGHPGAPSLAGRAVEQVIDAAVGPVAATRALSAPVLADESDTTLDALPYKLVARTGVCAHLHLLSGRCPTAPGEVLQSSRDVGMHPALTGPARDRLGPFTVVGTYAVPDFSDPSWYGRYDIYFAQPGPDEIYPTDALFATQATVDLLGKGGVAVVDIGLRPSDVSPTELAGANRAFAAVLNSSSLNAAGYAPVSVLGATTAAIHSQWSALAIPTLLATAELLLLVWMLLFLVVNEGVEARGAEVALAKLRGLPTRRVLATALAEPLLVLGVAVPIGALLGWLAARLLAHAQLAAGTPVPLPGLSWAAAAGAVLGGVGALLASSRQVLRRSPFDQWRRTPRGATGRGWIVDAVVLTAAVAGLVQLGLSGVIGSSSQGLQVELVPGLLALAVAVVSSRLLPLACRGVAVLTRRRGGLAGFLAVRYVARRPGGTRATIALATAVAIALFGVAVSTVGRTDRDRVAGQDVGAATVLSVVPPTGHDLAAIVDGLDPSGRQAVAVSALYQGAGSPTILATDPQRFAAVASWLPGTPIAAVARDLAPPVTRPVTVTGDALRIRFVHGPPPGTALSALVTVGGAAGGGENSVDLSAGPAGTYTGALTNCPCALSYLSVSGPQGSVVSGAATLVQVQVHGPTTGWRSLGQDAVTGWQVPPASGGGDSIARTSAGLRWTFQTEQGGDAELESTDRPDPLPAVGAAGAVGDVGTTTPGIGLDGRTQLVSTVAVASSVPGAPGEGIVVDRDYALRASGGIDQSRQQVWLAAGAQSMVEKLRAAGVQIQGISTTAQMRIELDREGPALASTVLLFDAAVAALLAALGTMVSLVGAARRRRYEYASLVAGGASRWAIWRSLLLEQTLVLGYGLAVGVAAGVAGMLLVLRKIPVLQTVPVSPPLTFALPGAALLGALALVVAVVAAVAVAVATGLVASVTPAALRESGP